MLALQPNHTTARENRDIALTKKNRFDPTTIGALILIIAIIIGSVYVYTKPRNLRSDLKPGKKGPELKVHEGITPEKKPKEKKLFYGAIPEESRLHTLASLCSVINIAGISILDDPEKVSALLNEYSRGEYEKERNALILALDDHIPQDLLKSPRGFTLVNTSEKLRKRLMDHYDMPEDLARWTIETWVKALETEKWADEPDDLIRLISPYSP